MRERLGVALALALAAPGAAHAAPGAKLKSIDVSASVGRLDVFKDDHGMFYVSPHAHDPDLTGDEQLVFFGDGKTMYRQRVIGTMSDGTGYAWTLWAPRAIRLPSANLRLLAPDPTLSCTPGEPRKLTLLPADQAKQILTHATFLPPLWVRQIKLLARDDTGTYYLVDRLQDEHGGKDYRIYAGLKGAMTELPITNLANDSAGEIYATKRGVLKVSANGDAEPTIVWIKNGVKTDLIGLDPHVNHYLIYRELGIYSALGAVCDDQ